jgi:DNA-binding NarL/FixJ family response regulator
VSDTSPSAESAASDGPSALTPTERAVLKLLEQGRRNRTIATSLQLTEQDVADHVSHILDKLQVTSRRAAAAIAVAHRS